MNKVTIYTIPSCPYCNAAKALLKSKMASYEEINVENDDEKRKWLQKVTGQRTVPQIFIGDQSIGGYQELKQLDQDGKLDEKLLKP